MIDQWLEANFNPVLDASDGKEKRIDCPFCEARHGDPDRKQHLYVSTVVQACHCFRCGWSGSQLDLVMGVTGCNYMEALIAIETPKPNIGLFKSALASPRGLIHVDAKTPAGFKRLNDPGFVGSHECISVTNYLRRRNVPYHLMDRSFGMIPGTNRAWIVIDHKYWQGRSIIGAVEPKYVNPPWAKVDSIWNWQILAKAQQLIICEGVFSAIAASPTNAIALLGKTATAEQVARIVQHQIPKMTIMLDKGAEVEAVKLAEQLMLAGYSGQLYLHWLTVGQPDDGLDGTVEPWTFTTKVRHLLASTV